MPFTSRLEAQAAVLKSWTFTDNRRARTEPARQAFYANMLKQVNPDGELGTREAHLRADDLYRAHFKSLAAKSIRVRQKKAQQRKADAKGTKAVRVREIT